MFAEKTSFHVTSSASLPFQKETKQSARCCWMLPRPISSNGKSRRYRCIGNCAGRTVRYLNISIYKKLSLWPTIFIISTIYTPKRADWAGFNSCTLRSVCAWERVKTLRQCHATTPAEREIKALLRKHKTNGGGRNNIMTSCCCYSRPISLRHRTFDTIHEKIPRHTDLGKKSAIYVKGQKKK
jgi:hypothetical protein